MGGALLPGCNNVKFFAIFSKTHLVICERLVWHGEMHYGKKTNYRVYLCAWVLLINYKSASLLWWKPCIHYCREGYLKNIIMIMTHYITSLILKTDCTENLLMCVEQIYMAAGLRLSGIYLLQNLLMNLSLSRQMRWVTRAESWQTSAAVECRGVINSTVLE